MPVSESKGIDSFWDSGRKLVFNFLLISNTKGMLIKNRKGNVGSQLTATRGALPFETCSCSPCLGTEKCCPGSCPWLSTGSLPPTVTCPAPRHSSHVPQRNSHLRLLRSSDILIWQTCPGIPDKNKRFWILYGFLLSVVKMDHCTKFSVRKT